MGASQRNKGARGERSVVNLLKDAGIHAERVVLSGAVKNRRMGNGHDVDAFAPWRANGAPFCGEVKVGAQVPVFFEKALGENDFLVCRRDRGQPIVTMPWNIFVEMMRGGRG